MLAVRKGADRLARASPPLQPAGHAPCDLVLGRADMAGVDEG